MVHKKSNYSLTYKKIGPKDLCSLYEENTSNRHLYGLAHQTHQPLPFEEDPCECDDDADKATPPRRSEAKKSSKRTFKSASMGPVRPTHSPLRSSHLKRSSSSNDLGAWKSAQDKHGVDLHDANLLHRCTFCGKDFKSLNDSYELDTNHLNTGPSVRHDARDAAMVSSRPTREGGVERHNRGAGRHNGKSGRNTTVVQTTDLAEEAARAEASAGPGLENTVHFSKVDPDHGFLGVLKCHPLFREYDLIPATLPPFRKRPTKLEGRSDWNAGGDRAPEPHKPRRPQSGQQVRRSNALGRLSASTGSVVAATPSQTLGVRGETRALHERSRTPCATVSSAARGRREAQRDNPSGAEAPQFSDMSRCRNCRILYWGRLP